MICEELFISKGGCSSELCEGLVSSTSPYSQDSFKLACNTWGEVDREAGTLTRPGWWWWWRYIIIK